jgi:hypothetical protein
MVLNLKIESHMPCPNPAAEPIQNPPTVLHNKNPYLRIFVLQVLLTAAAVVVQHRSADLLLLRLVLLRQSAASIPTGYVSFRDNARLESLDTDESSCSDANLCWRD